MPQMFQDCVPEDLLFLYYLPYQNYLSQGRGPYLFGRVKDLNTIPVKLGLRS